MSRVAEEVPQDAGEEPAVQAHDQAVRVAAGDLHRREAARQRPHVARQRQAGDLVLGQDGAHEKKIVRSVDHDEVLAGESRIGGKAGDRGLDRMSESCQHRDLQRNEERRQDQAHRQEQAGGAAGGDPPTP
jgi:hypothetical protein